ncbi:hypothetical protein IFO70_12555 [Phormidium tenue FACHB-886]|nr:hypothetical protein [Phormidium tenue FACHB-886]
MNLPLVIEIAIGLIFIYLVLSLLTSELQELIAILLQWRAEHLKKSIENLLTGNAIDNPIYQEFANEFYESPLIQSLNQEAKGLLAVFFRRIVQALTHIYYVVTRTRGVFDRQKSGPSYIPAETFSVALLQKLNIDQLSQRISELTARKFSDERLFLLQSILEDLRNSLGDNSFLEHEFKALQRGLAGTIDDFISGRATLSNSIEEVSNQLIQFIENTETLLGEDNHCKEIIRHRLPYLKQTISQQQLEPTITEVLRLIFENDVDRHVKISPWLAEIVEMLDREQPDLLKNVATLPESLKQNMLSLAKQARTKANSLEEEVRQLETEVADWFNNSMERASGVYRRNSKGVGILIGLSVAILINADTMHIVGRLSKDNLLRSTITQAADQMVMQTPAASPEAELARVRTAVNTELNKIPLPIGWNPINLQEQAISDREWPVPFLRRAIGWLTTGIALSMGASFWFDLLKRVVQVRATGDKPDGK